MIRKRAGQNRHGGMPRWYSYEDDPEVCVGQKPAWGNCLVQ
jgi:hypothetical protein